MSQAQDGVIEIISARERPLGGFTVRRLLPTARRKTVGPWIFLDHMGPADFAPDQGIDVRPHPHIGLATVTYLFEGEILHRDSLGNTQTITPGDINLMVAGRGITHSERERPQVRASAHRLHGLQLWLALPDADEECAPSFHHYAADALPRVQIDGVSARVMMGAAWGVRSPVPTYAGALYAEAELQAGQRLPLPQATQLAIYLARGSLRIGGATVPEHTLAVVDSSVASQMQASSDTRIALIGGDGVGERFIDWNFVASTRERIAQAREDWEQQRFAKVVGDTQEYIALPK
ncbi:pirin family protein [Comamonas sp. NLF-1-9]|uniref:pirin family protein n=1 Tax=Comamonas sp. NLF-1-9 TaxID=2853163 RepID=UPI001C454DC3|nr:pirin family protein [Comamonas sp. NLF-1-9]QXL85451.1 pirin family protein [Comamonas sp. NLF-1-9]